MPRSRRPQPVPRSARWNAWLWALTKPGSVTSRATGDDTNLRRCSLESVPAPLRQLPNALTILRFVAIPVFVALLVRDQDGPSWRGGDRLRARRDHRPARRVARAPLARRVGLRQGRRPARRPLMIDVCVVLLVVVRPASLGRARDPAPRPHFWSAATRSSFPRGYEFEVSRLGKVATWGLYASLALVLVTERDTWWPLALLLGEPRPRGGCRRPVRRQGGAGGAR